MNTFLTLASFGHHWARPVRSWVITSVWLLTVVLPRSVFGQQLAYLDAPEPKPMLRAAPLAIVARTKPPAHNFFSDRQNAIAFSVAVALRTADSAYTCAVGVGTTNHHADGSVTVNREDMLPVNSCRGVVLMNAGFTGLGLGSSYALHKMGRHKLEKVPNWIVAAVPAWGIGYTATHRHVVRK